MEMLAFKDRQCVGIAKVIRRDFSVTVEVDGRTFRSLQAARNAGYSVYLKTCMDDIKKTREFYNHKWPGATRG